MCCNFESKMNIQLYWNNVPRFQLLQNFVDLKQQKQSSFIWFFGALFHLSTIKGTRSKQNHRKQIVQQIYVHKTQTCLFISTHWHAKNMPYSRWGTSKKESSSAVMQRETRKIIFKDLRFLDQLIVFLKLEFLVPLLQNLNVIFVL